MEKLIKPKEAAGMLAVTIDTLRKWVDAKQLSEIRTIGNHRRYKLSEIEGIIKKYEQ